MGDSAGKLADAFHFLRLEQLVLEGAFARDVAHVENDAGLPFCPAHHQRIGIDVEFAQPQRGLHLAGHLRRLAVANGLRARAAGAIRTEYLAGLADQRHPVRKELLHGGIGPDDLQVRVQHRDAVLHAGKDVFEEIALLGQPGLGFPAAPGAFGGFDGAVHGNSQAPQMLLHHVVRRAQPHGFRRALFADGARHENERNVPFGFPGPLQRVRAAIPRQAVVGNDHVHVALGQFALEILRLRHDDDVEIQMVAAEHVLHEHGIEGAVFQMEDFQLPDRFCRRRSRWRGFRI